MLLQIARRVIQVVPETVALSIARNLATRTERAPVTPAEQAAMLGATKIYYGANNRNVAWAWGEGPLVIFVHGWGGRASQMALLASYVSKLGFRSVALDVTGHGSSSESHTRWEYFLRDIAALSQSLETTVHAYVGHSAGGLTMMAARRLKGIGAKRYVCICAPSHPHPPIKAIQKKLNPRQGVLELYKQHIAGQFESTWERLQTGCSFADTGSDLLLIYDETDRYIDHAEGDRIQRLCPGSELVKYRGYGHVKILAAPEMIQTVGRFLEPVAER
jgi:pimeloyl-ACP methyl ester carboxylesterase